jgi:hypothetical protein
MSIDYEFEQFNPNNPIKISIHEKFYSPKLKMLKLSDNGHSTILI